jgi:hypothetical protein
VTALLREVLKELDKVELPEGFTIDKEDVMHQEMFKDGYLMIDYRRIGVACITDIGNHNRAISPGLKGPLSIEKYDNKEWSAVCDADTPEQVVMAFITFATFGEFT